MQFHTVTDGFDQFDAPIDAFNFTTAALGQPPTTLLVTDNPTRDRTYFTQRFAGVRALQSRLDALGSRRQVCT